MANFITLAIEWLLSWFRKAPAGANETVREIERRAIMDKPIGEAELLAEIRAGLEKAAAERKTAETKLIELAAERDRQKKVRKKLKQAAEAIEKRERLMVEHKQREQQVEDQKKRLLEEEREVKERERILQEKQHMQELLEQERAARERAENGFQPIKWPTGEELQRARHLIQYNEAHLHFAIVGRSGTGKSSLINAFLDRKSGDPGAAATGVTETTSMVTRYPDPGEQPPRPWTMWYDVPGAGTQNIPAWQYFINQGLFVFDLILIAIGDRFEETDIQLLRDCHRFKIPSFIVRSKADMHIDNMMKEENPDRGLMINLESYWRCRERFIRQSQQMIRTELANAELPEQAVYLVSSYILRTVYNRSLCGLESGLPEEMIDEMELVRGLMVAAIQRRGGNDRAFQTALDVAMRGETFMSDTAEAGRNVGSMIQAVSSQSLNALRRLGSRVQGWGTNTPQALQLDQSAGSTRPEPRQSNHAGPSQNIQWIKRVIYLPTPLTVEQLEQELRASNPGLDTTFAAPPWMLSATTAVLTFPLGNWIPLRVVMFGRVLGTKDFKERGHNTTRNLNPQTDRFAGTSRDNQVAPVPPSGPNTHPPRAKKGRGKNAKQPRQDC